MKDFAYRIEREVFAAFVVDGYYVREDDSILSLTEDITKAWMLNMDGGVAPDVVKEVLDGRDATLDNIASTLQEYFQGRTGEFVRIDREVMISDTCVEMTDDSTFTYAIEDENTEGLLFEDLPIAGEMDVVLNVGRIFGKDGRLFVEVKSLDGEHVNLMRLQRSARLPENLEEVENGLCLISGTLDDIEITRYEPGEGQK